MDRCEVLIVGGGPAGSTCAWKLRAAGVDVAVIDRAAFPRDKVCAGWITPQVVDELQIDTDDYRARRTFQPITGFRIGLIGADEAVEASYASPVSFGIRRCEFDDYLLRRSGARLLLDVPVSRIRRSGAKWVINETIEASMLVGAGGHFCPVGRLLNGQSDRALLVAAQEAECRIESRDASRVAVAAETPELYFCRDLEGYGWCFRKQNYLNVGFGRITDHGLPRATAAFVDFLTARRRISDDASWRWHGHAYRLFAPSGRRVADEAVLLLGDSAGLAYRQSGEGIRPAVESGLIAASTILEAGGRYSRDRLESYARRLQKRFGSGVLGRLLASRIPAAFTKAAPYMLRQPWFVRHLLLDRWFLHAAAPAI